MSVVSDRAQWVSNGVNSPASANVVSRAASLATTERDRRACAPTVALPIPLKRRIVKSTTASP